APLRPQPARLLHDVRVRAQRRAAVLRGGSAGRTGPAPTRSWFPRAGRPRPYGVLGVGAGVPRPPRTRQRIQRAPRRRSNSGIGLWPSRIGRWPIPWTRACVPRGLSHPWRAARSWVRLGGAMKTEDLTAWREAACEAAWRAAAVLQEWR